MPETAFKEVRDRCYKMLAYRSRTAYELQTRLEKAGFEPSVIKTVLSWLMERGLINDRLFAREWIAMRKKAKPVGSGYLRAELLQKGVDRDIIADELHGYDEDSQYEAALRLAYGKMSPDAEIKWRRIAGLLFRRGFGRSVINKVYRAIVEDGRFDIS